MRHIRLLLVGLVVVGGAASAGLVACVGDSPVGGDAGAGADGSLTESGLADGPTGCAARTADDSTGVFVQGTGTDVNGCGTRNGPCKTVQYAIFSATQGKGKTTVYVAASNQPYVESVTLSPGVTVEGGWAVTGTSWTPVCDSTTSAAVTIQGVTNKTITASFDGSAALRYLTITSKLAADPGESLYGIFATGSTTDLTLDQVVVQVAAGGTGSDGTPGAPGTSGTGSCAAGSASAGGAGNPGAGATAGSLSDTGYNPTSGGDAGAGSAGTNGKAGTQSCATCDTCSGNCVFGSQTVCSTAGLAGCAGQPGTGGACGFGGGSSIAVFLWDAHLTTFGGSFTAGNGGNGGNGGQGGDGGAGSPGTAGTNATCVTQFKCSNGCAINTEATLNGGDGGAGGNGGNGGQGGGGSGGLSYGLVQGGDGGVLINGGTTLAHGNPGSGGAVGGAPGASADRWP